MKKRNLLLIAFSIIGLAVAVSGCGIANTNTRTTGTAQAIQKSKIKIGMSEIAFMRKFGNPTRVIKVDRAYSKFRSREYTVFLYCLSRTSRAHYLFNLINKKSVKNTCKSFYFWRNKLVKIN